jgi:hypothetical protein
MVLRKRIIILICIFSISFQCFAAELCVKITQKGDKSYEIGDIMAVKNDDIGWGTKEGLPDFVIIKYPGIPTEKLKFLELPLLYKEESKKVRKYSISSLVIDFAKLTEGKGTYTGTISELNEIFKNHIKVSTLTLDGEINDVKENLSIDILSQ